MILIKFEVQENKNDIILFENLNINLEIIKYKIG